MSVDLFTRSTIKQTVYATELMKLWKTIISVMFLMMSMRLKIRLKIKQ